MKTALLVVALVILLLPQSIQCQSKYEKGSFTTSINGEGSFYISGYSYVSSGFALYHYLRERIGWGIEPSYSLEYLGSGYWRWVLAVSPLFKYHFGFHENLFTELGVGYSLNRFSPKHRFDFKYGLGYGIPIKNNVSLDILLYGKYQFGKSTDMNKRIFSQLGLTIFI